MLFVKRKKRGKRKDPQITAWNRGQWTKTNLTHVRHHSHHLDLLQVDPTSFFASGASFNKLRSGEQATKSLVPCHIKSKKGLFLKSLVIMLSVTGFSLLPRVLPIMVYTGRLRPEGVPFSGLRSVYERVEILLVEVYETLEKSVRLGLWNSLKGLTDEFYDLIMSRKCSIFATDCYLKVIAFTAVKRDAKF